MPSRCAHVPKTHRGQIQTPTPQPLSAHGPAALAEREQRGSKAELGESFLVALQLLTRVLPLLQSIRRHCKKTHSPNEMGTIWVFTTFQAPPENRPAGRQQANWQKRGHTI